MAASFFTDGCRSGDLAPNLAALLDLQFNCLVKFIHLHILTHGRCMKSCHIKHNLFHLVGRYGTETVEDKLLQCIKSQDIPPVLVSSLRI